MRSPVRPQALAYAQAGAVSSTEVKGFSRTRDNPAIESKEERPMSDTQQRIDDLVKSNDITLFMKGSASFPMCGFSGRAIQILKACGVDPKNVKTVNVLEDPEIRQGIKEYSNWPTIPQLYIKGEFIGGSDIMMDMYESGELQQVIAGKA